MRGLILSGGGVKGSYQCGSIKYLMRDLNRHYDVFCGVSVGGINASFLSQYHSGEESEATYELESIWKSIDSSQIYKKWSILGRISALFRPSFYDGKPLYNLINKNLNLNMLRKSDKVSYVGCTSMSTGNYKVFSSKEPNFKRAVVAGASFPILMNPIKINDEYYSDGGIMEITPTQIGIDAGCDELDIIICSPETRKKTIINSPSISDSLRRTINLAADQIMSHDLDRLLMYNKLISAGFEKEKKIVKINIIRPNTELVSNQMNFNKKDIERLIKIGYDDAKMQFKG